MAVSLAMRLDPRRFESVLCATRSVGKPTFEDDLRAAGVEIMRLDRRSRIDLAAWRPLVRLSARRRPRPPCAQVRLERLGHAARAARAGSGRHRARAELGLCAFVDRRAVRSQHDRPRGDRAWSGRLHRRVRGGQAADDRGRGNPSRRLRVMPNAVPAPVPTGHDVRAELGIPAGAPVVVTVCQLRAREGALRCSSRRPPWCAVASPELRVLVAGDGAERGRLRVAHRGAGACRHACSCLGPGATCRTCSSPRTWRSAARTSKGLRSRSWSTWVPGSRSSRPASAACPRSSRTACRVFSSSRATRRGSRTRSRACSRTSLFGDVWGRRPGPGSAPASISTAPSAGSRISTTSCFSPRGAWTAGHLERLRVLSRDASRRHLHRGQRLQPSRPAGARRPPSPSSSASSPSTSRSAAMWGRLRAEWRRSGWRTADVLAFRLFYGALLRRKDTEWIRGRADEELAALPAVPRRAGARDGGPQLRGNPPVPAGGRAGLVVAACKTILQP